MQKTALFAGTAEGRKLAQILAESKGEVHVCVTTEYGASLIPHAENIHIHTGRMEEEDMETFLKEKGIELCLDATHPYADQVTGNIQRACEKLNIERMRILRREENAATGADCVFVASVEEAAAYLEHTKGNVLVTTGSKELKKYTVLSDYKNRVFARVLSTAEVAAACKEIGFEGKNLICMQGPFSEELNYAMLKQINAAYLVTKSSGAAGGFEEKCEAAIRAGAKLIIVGRPKEKEQGISLDEAVLILKKRLGISECEWENSAVYPVKREAYLIGAGAGNPKLMTAEARECLDRCDCIIGAGRILDICERRENQVFYESYQGEEIAAFLKENRQLHRIGLVFSGDMGFYSAARRMEPYLKDFTVFRIPGIASPVYFLDRLGIPWEEVKLTSCHGKEICMTSLLKKHKRVCTLLGKENDVSEICKELLDAGMDHVRVTVGERLSYDDERISEGSVCELVSANFNSLSVALFENDKISEDKVHPEAGNAFFEKTDKSAGGAGMYPGISDEQFIRGKVPMTKEEIRILSLAKLHMKPDMVLYDIGAGTGSISIEAALQCPKSRIYAVEKNPEGIGLLKENMQKFHVSGIVPIEGNAPKILEELESPTHVFIGGSGNRLQEIVEAVRSKNPKARFVINGVTLETVGAMEKILRNYPEYENMEIVQVCISKGKKMGEHTMMLGQNPVYICSFGGEQQ
ncbi:MAG: precorrin-6A reductase [Lachnospiraceae bacterium]|nr:precorrin-6A reductase [Lachnospiraceae bacterium]